MTKKDHELIAKVIREQRTNVEAVEQRRVDYLALHLARELEKDNPRFNRDTFLVACGVNL